MRGSSESTCPAAEEPCKLHGVSVLTPCWYGANCRIARAPHIENRAYNTYELAHLVRYSHREDIEPPLYHPRVWYQPPHSNRHSVTMLQAGLMSIGQRGHGIL